MKKISKKQLNRIKLETLDYFKMMNDQQTLVMISRFQYLNKRLEPETLNKMINQIIDMMQDYCEPLPN